MESGPMGPYLSAIAAELQQQGYARSTIRRHLRAADHFGAWLVKQGLSLKDIGEPLVDRYLKGLNRQFSSSCPGGRLLHKALGIPELVRFLRRQGVLQTNVGLAQERYAKSHRILANCLGVKDFGDSGIPKTRPVLVGQFWGLDSDRILKLVLREIILSQNVSPHGVYQMHRFN